MRWVVAMSDIGGAIRSIDELVEEATRLHVLLRGTDAYPGILAQASDLAESLKAVSGQLTSAAQLSEQLDALPERLLRSADDMQFKAALRESIAQVLSDSIIDAKIQVQDEAAQMAIDELSSKIKLAMSQLGESSANFLAERNKLRGLLESERIKCDALAHRMKYFEEDKDKSFGLLADDFAEASRHSANVRLRDCCVCLVIGAVVSLTTLVPAAEQYLKQPTQHYQQR